MGLFICIEIQSLSNKSGNTFLKIDLADFCRIVNGHIAHTTSIVIANQILSEVTVNLKPDLTDMIEFCWG